MGLSRKPHGLPNLSTRKETGRFDTISYRLLGAHVNATLNGLAPVLSEWRPPLMVVLDHSEVWHSVKAASPDTVIVGRIHREFEPRFGDPSLDPLQAARDHCELLLPWAERMGDTYDFWQGVNEPDIQSREGMQRYADFDAERVRIMDGHGVRVVVGTLSVGNPSNLAWWQEYVPALEEALRYGGALALHEYGWPTLDHESPWYLLRHRKLYEGEPEHNWHGLPEHLKNMPLVITECGLDGMIDSGRGPRGWQVRHGLNPRQYLKELAWYDAELCKDPYVVGAAIYCCCSSNDPNWGTYNIWPEPARTLARKAKPVYRLEELRNLPKVVPPPESVPRSVIELPAPVEGDLPEAQDPDQGTIPTHADEQASSPAPRSPGDSSQLPPAPPPPPSTPDEDTMLQQALERLERIVELLQQGHQAGTSSEGNQEDTGG
jgi:hypothetical protein